MACGKPVLASNLPGVRAVVVGGRNGLVFVAKNSADIAEKIVELFGDEERYALFAKNCLEVVEEKYRWSVIVDKIEAMFVKKL
jgi:glycosyltransferase involved in cell wall biosynthesis